jgi:hypothetical protein
VAAVAASPCPPPPCVRHPLPLPLWWHGWWQGWWQWQWKIAIVVKKEGGTSIKANADGNGMDEDVEGSKIKYRKIKYLLSYFMPSSPPTLPSLGPCSHASCLPQLVGMLPLVFRHLRLLLCHRILSDGASTCPPLIALLPLVVPLFFSGAAASCPPRLFVVSPLIMPPPPVCLCLHLSLHHRLSSCLSLS